VEIVKKFLFYKMAIGRVASGRTCLWFGLWFCAASAMAASAVGQGSVDIASYDANTQVLLLSGWAAPESPQVYTSNIVVTVGNQQIYRGRFLRSIRPDVVSARQRSDWLWSGWRVEINTPTLAPGTHNVRVELLLTNGETFAIANSPSVHAIDIPPKSLPSIKSRLLLAIALLLPAMALFFPGAVQRWTKQRWPAATVFFATIVLSFLLLVASGFTGSSVRHALHDSPVLAHDAIAWLGQARFIRMDEWNILTQMAIGQVNASLHFPLLNRNVGLDGNNMLLIGMTGVPVSHLSALAKPATWGFWLFDLRGALAWHWWFPFFACFLALWAVLIRFLKVDWRIASMLAVTLPASPYSVVFSGHPAYAVFFPLLSLWLLDRIFSINRPSVAAALGAMLGLSLAGFVLVLYPPWQITLLYLLVPLGVGHFVSRRPAFLFGKAQFIAILLALAIALGLIGSWLIDTKEVLQTVAATVYPGQRATSVGGDIDPWFAIKGLLSPITMYQETPFMNASDAGSFMWLWLSLVAACGLVCWNDRKLHLVPVLIVGFLGLTLGYIYLGFSIPVAQYSLWGRVTSYRLDLALGLAQLFLLAWLISVKASVFGHALTAAASRLAIGVGLACAGLSVWLFGLLPVPIANIFTPGYVLLASAVLGIVSYLVMAQRPVLAAGIYCVWMLGTSMPFNPIDLAPSQVRLEPALKSALQAPGSPGGIRLAVLDMHRWRMNLVAAGEPVVNAVLYYPQETLWKSLDPDGKFKTLYNRYQNLEFSTAELPGIDGFQIDALQLDLVNVTIDPRHFDFRKLGATHLLTSPRTASLLMGNSSLRHFASDGKWVLLKVAA